MKNKNILLVTLIFGTTVAMNEPCNPALLHQPIHGYLEPCLTSWIFNMIYNTGTVIAPACILNCHTSPVCHLAITPDGYSVITASEDHKIRIWDTSTCTCQYALEDHKGPIEDFKIVPGHNFVLSASQDGTARLWDIKTGSCLKTMAGHRNSVLETTLTPDGTIAATRSADNTACIWNLVSGKCVSMLDCNPRTVHQVLIAPDGKTAITRSGENSIQVWDTETGTCRYELPAHPVEYRYSMRMPDQLNITTRDIRHDGPITNLFLSPDGQTIVTIDNYVGGAYAYDVATGVRRCILSKSGYIHSHRYDKNDFIKTIAFVPDGNTIIAAFNQDSLRRIDLSSGACQELFTGGYPIKTISMCPGAQTAVGCSTYNTLHLWDLHSNRTFIVNNSDPRSLIKRGVDETMCMQEFKMPAWGKIQNMAHALLGQYQLYNSPFHQYPTFAALSPGAQTAITTSKNHALVWNIPEGTLRHVLPNPCIEMSGCQEEPRMGLMAKMWLYGASLFNKAYNRMVMNSDGTCMATVTTDGKAVNIWNIAKQEHTDVLDQLSVLQITLLEEIQQRVHIANPRLILRPGTDNHRAYQSLYPIIKNAIRPHIGIHKKKTDNY